MNKYNKSLSDRNEIVLSPHIALEPRIQKRQIRYDQTRPRSRLMDDNLPGQVRAPTGNGGELAVATGRRTVVCNGPGGPDESTRPKEQDVLWRGAEPAS